MGSGVTTTNGWVAFDSDQTGGDDIYLVRPGEAPRRLDVAGAGTTDEVCPAFSPDGTRLLFGRATGSSDTAYRDAELVIVDVEPDGRIGLPATISIEGLDALPCAIWAPDGRWVAFGGGGDVWVVDMQTSEIRQLPDLRPSDLEWRPGTDELTIAGDVGTSRGDPTLATAVTIYSATTGEVRTLADVRAGSLTWSPDGSTLAFSGGENDPGGLWLVDAEGSNQRLLVSDDTEASHGIGPVWSPAGDRIAYQRLCTQTAEWRYAQEHPDEHLGYGRSITGICREEHEVVVVSATDTDPKSPIGTQTVIEPPKTDGPNGPIWWYPTSVTWSPDGTTLLYTAWASDPAVPGGVIAVPADTPTDAAVLTDTIGPGAYDGHPWVPIRQWGRQPG